jgi:outer membrane immunogenic protein
LTKVGSKISGVVLMAASLTTAMMSGAGAVDLASIYYGGPARSFAFTWAEPAGFNWQNGNIAYGGEADINFSAANDTFAPWFFSNPWFATLRGSAGIGNNNVLLFGTAGLAYGEITGTTPGNFSENHSSVRWVAGRRVEMSFAQLWSAKAEWLYLDLDDRYFSVTAANNGLAANLVRLGLNYHF